ncbi:gamma-glutamylcyclotransferase [Actinokineospora sp. UTMC 2448]|uniref:gamma-glutamylcyclotransferase family protein n=1 Tax=Actinokineospora sp. UTMC 2448 TaxID=2268449 RepID=UPI00216420A7|nr:gamma-glutamylcyclotransferase family protein [Actinokineospora sp. UTMC 2448]UVS76846.1 Gamma-L-glutamyl-butirosin B gamma-glutamyl cyclotransferase [Actinokineospora sp. UTMC 2448]
MFTDADYPAAPYPGTRPPTSFVHTDGRGFPLAPDPAALSGWRVGADDLDAWLAARSCPPLADRVPLLSYGSNACPSKLTWLRAAHGLGGPVVVLRARTSGLSAVWAAGLRVVDDQRPAVLAAAPDAVEDHALLMVAEEQLAAFDKCEGRGDRYHLATVATGTVSTEDGGAWDRVLAYAGAREIRRPLLVRGAAVPCSAVSQEDAVHLVGTPAEDDGLAATPVSGPPDPRDFPGSLFVYGTLQPGAAAWHLMAPHADGPARPASLSGALYDTGFGYPALLRGAGSVVSGWSVPLRSGAALAALDEYEGPQYARVRVVLTDGSVAWTYVWLRPVSGMRLLGGPWR